ncbi:MAG: hypothetical protein ACLPSW_24060 [Roseiarcus sp.]
MRRVILARMGSPGVAATSIGGPARAYAKGEPYASRPAVTE